MKAKVISIFITTFFVLGCEKNSFWIGQDEFVTFTYNHPNLGVFNFPEEADNKSPNLHYNGNGFKSEGDNITLSVYGVEVSNLRRVAEIDDVKVLEKQDDKFIELFEEQGVTNDVVFERADIAVIINYDASNSVIEIEFS